MHSETDLHFMKLAIEQAQIASVLGEVPVGALLVRKNGEILSAKGNRKESLRQACAHAEVLVIEEGCRKTGAWRLTDATLYVTLEPCLMCCGAIIQARIPRVVYGARDTKTGSVESLYQCLSDQRLNHRPEVVGGVLEPLASGLLSEFFKARRAQRETLLPKKTFPGASPSGITHRI